jgi:hypothetical protein
MPFTRIALLKGKSPAFLQAISASLHTAMVETFDVPPHDRFQAFDQYEPGELVFDADYLGGPRSDDFILFTITAGKPRSGATKRTFFKRLVALLTDSPGIRPQDIMVIINTTSGDGWSFSGGDPALPLLSPEERQALQQPKNPS